MKAVLMAIHPEWCEKIFRGEKTIEVRKTAPKETPFKVYIYETKAGFIEAVRGTCPRCAFSRGNVIGEFVCNDIDMIVPDFQYGYLNYLDIENTCLSVREMEEYGKCKTLRGLHITAPKLYDTPKELEVFWSVRCTNKKGDCEKCEVKPACINNITCPPRNYCYVEEIKE